MVFFWSSFSCFAEGATIHAFIPKDRASAGIQASASCSRTLPLCEEEPRDGGDRRHINLAELTRPTSERLLIHEPAADSFLMCNKLIRHHSPATRLHSLVDEGVNVGLSFSFKEQLL